MSHPEQVAFFRAVAAANQDLVDGGRVIEIGSYDVNGTIRDIFAKASAYTGVDLVAGPGVDHVGFGHAVDAPDGSYDIAISGEAFEHDEHWPETLTNMARLTRPGGLVAFTCASTGRPEHGTRRTSPDASPGTQSVGSDYYRNLTAADVSAQVDLNTHFTSFRFWQVDTSFDLYFAGVRRGLTDELTGALPSNEQVEAISSLMPFAHRVLRWPLRGLAAVIPEHRYQTIAIRYWRLQERAQQMPVLSRFKRAT